MYGVYTSTTTHINQICNENPASDLFVYELTERKTYAKAILCSFTENADLIRFMKILSPYEGVICRIPAISTDSVNVDTARRIYKEYMKREEKADATLRAELAQRDADIAELCQIICELKDEKYRAQRTVERLRKHNDAVKQLACAAGGIHDDVRQLRETLERMTME
jgi:hypothetical protein